MEKIARKNMAQRSELFHETASIMGIPDAIAEKDFWVCFVLKYLFEKSRLAQHIIFKGGTSLSKVFGIIQRFSEDIDLILDWGMLGVSNDEPWQKRSHTKQDGFNKEVNKRAQVFIKNDFFGTVKDDFERFGIEGLMPDLDHDDLFVINIRYPRSFADSYIRPFVRLEIGPLASWIPHDKYTIKPYAAEFFPRQFVDPYCQVISIKAERSFWEKATIIHQEAHRPSDKAPPLRYSRHYYDLFMMSMHKVKDTATADYRLLADVVEFKMRFYPCKWANYENARPGTFRLLPDGSNMKHLKDDYARMREMIFGTKPEFDEIVERLAAMEHEINGMAK